MTVNINDVVETITPDRAKQLLEMNTRNRNVLHSNLDILTEEIRKGRFVANGDAIRIAKDGTILDGQHRLLACVRANRPIKAIVITGLEESTQYTMDSGTRRTLGSQLSLLGIKNANKLAAIITILYNDECLNKPISAIAAHPQQCTPSAGVAYYETHPGIVDYWHKCARLDAGNLVNEPVVALLWKHFAEVSTPEDADAFFEQLRDGINLYRDSPIYVLRSTLIANKSKQKQNKLPRKNKIALIIKAWNKFIRGESCKLLVWQCGGAKPEPFPEIKGAY